MKKLLICFIALYALGFLTLITAPSAEAEIQAICVPWQPSDPDFPHYTYSGATTTLKGIARGDDATEYRWDFGDGNGTAWTAITDPYNLGVQHTYTGTTGHLFTATLYVRDGLGNEAQDDYFVEIFESSDLSIPEQLDVRINMAIDEGLWWLHKTMNRQTFSGGSPGYGQPYGYWNYADTGKIVAASCASVDAFQLHGSKANMDYDSDPYVETVQRALNYLLYNTYYFSIGVQNAGWPDSNGNGIGLVTSPSSSPYSALQTSTGGICMTALANSGAPSSIATVGRPYVYGSTYSDILQDMIDFFAWGQNESISINRGGWRYYANSSTSDMLETPWPPLGILAAEKKMGLFVPQFVSDELMIYLDNMQYDFSSSYNGSFGFNAPGSFRSITQTAGGIIGHEFIGTTLTSPEIQSAIGYIYRHWNDAGTGPADTQLHGHSYGMYRVMKAFRIPSPDITEVTDYDYTIGTQTGNSFDWYYTPAGQTQEGLASYIVRTQQADGSWDDTVGIENVYDAFATGLRILTLLQCEGDGAIGDTDDDGVCDNLDVCQGDDFTGDSDSDGVCDDLDACPGFDDSADSDGDGVPDDCDVPVVDAGPDQIVYEGQIVTLDPATFYDLGTADTHTATINWGDGTPVEAGVVSESNGSGTVSGSHVYADDGFYAVTVCVIDDDGASACDTFTVIVNNVVPTLTAVVDQTVDEGLTVSLAPATFNDLGTLDTHTATINWGDGTVEAGAVSETPFGPPGSTLGADGTVSGSHVYADDGVYTATVCVIDDDGPYCWI
jgi:hypothetical protein